MIFAIKGVRISYNFIKEKKRQLKMKLSGLKEI
jgi:hypothetical protein